MNKINTNDGNHRRVFWSRLQIIRGFFSRLVNLVSVTQQDLMEAGVVRRRMRD